MTLLNPWALAGLALLAVPILVHLIARRRTRVLPFPTLRFIAPSRLLPVRTLRLTDPLLLALRCAIIAAAVFALTQPRFRTAARERGAAGVLARVIVVDTSASMQRASANGGNAVEAARREGLRIAGEAAVSVTVESAEPAAELRGAAEWLRHQTGAREIVVVSDFQLGAIDSTDVAALPREIGLTFVRVPAARAVAPAERIGDALIAARAEVADGSTVVIWSVAAAGDAAATSISMLAGDDDAEAARATLAAAQALASPPSDTARRIAIVFPGYARRAVLEGEARPPDAPWMAEVLASVAEAGRISDSGVGQVDGRERLLLFTDAAPGSVAAAEVALAAANALSPGVPAVEREPAAIPDAQLETWRRAPGAVVMQDEETGGFDGRWFWLVALALLVVETIVRRAPRGEPAPDVREPVEEPRARVA